MLIPNQMIENTWTQNNKELYIGLGYKFTKYKDKFEIKAEHLSKGFHKRVLVQCDFCGCIVNKKYQTYIMQHHEKYGDCCAKCQPQKNKLICMDKYGVDNGSKTPEAIEKIKNTNLEKYGVEYTLQSADVRRKGMQTLLENGNCPTSKQQLKLYELLKEIYEVCELNKPCGTKFLDCTICIDGQWIDIEYDGRYWHQDKERDRKRDEFCKSQGYKILRIDAEMSIPTKEQVIEKVEYLLNSEEDIAKIILDI